MGIRNTIFGRLKIKPIIFKIDTRIVGSSNNYSMNLPIVGGVYIINWGDGTIDSNSSHTYLVEGIYYIKIFNSYKNSYIAFNFSLTGDAKKLLEIVDFGEFLQVGQDSFNGCSNLILTNVIGVPSFIQTCRTMFFGCSSLTTINNLSEWNLANTNSIYAMFANCVNFNQVINFNTSSIVDAFRFLDGCIKFNSPVNINTSNLVNIMSMFNGCILFNQDINYTFPKVTSLASVFNNCTNLKPSTFYIDAPLATNVGAFITGVPFNGTANFHLNIPNVNAVDYLLASKGSFNPTIFYLNIDKATNLKALFLGSYFFNPSNFTFISNKGTNCDQMFINASSFNQPLPDFDTVNVSDMNVMFSGCTNFNQTLNFNVANVVNMHRMFDNAKNFNKDISGWNFNKNVLVTSFFNNKTGASYDTAFYSNLLIKFASTFIGTGRTANKTFNAPSIKRDTNGTSARAALLADGWSITDGGI